MKRTSWTALIAAFGLALGSQASASTIEIQIIDVDIEYDYLTGEITDAGSPTDEVSALFFENGGGAVGNLQNPPEDLSIDLTVPGVFDIDPAGDVVMSAAGGSLELLTPSSILSLDLASAEVTYLPVGSTFEFVFVGTVGSIASQSLPFGLVLGDPVAVTLSTQVVGDVVASATRVESFTASGTGEIEGEFIPEPASVALLSVVAGIAAARRR